MKTAILISGQMRTFASCYPNIRWMVLRHYPHAEFFVSCEDDAQASTAELLLEHYPADRVNIERVKQPFVPEPQHVELLRNRGPSRGAATTQAILRQLWHLNRVWDFFHECETKRRWAEKQALLVDRFQRIIRLRPDLFFHRFDPPAFPPCVITGNDISRHYDEPALRTCFTPWWSRWGGVNDRVAVMGPAAAAHYFRTFTVKEELFDSGAPLHPESLLLGSLELGRVNIRPTLSAVFTAIRADGNHVRPDYGLHDLADLQRELSRPA